MPDCAAIDTSITNQVNVASIVETKDSVTLTNSDATWAIAYDIDFLMDAFYVQNATKVTMKLSAKDYQITGFRFANGQTYGRVLIWKDKTTYSSLFNSDDTSRWEIVDGSAILTLNAADFKLC